MKLFKVATWADGDIVTPHELNAELRHQLGQLNGGLDVENLGTAPSTTDMDPSDDPWAAYSATKETSPQALAYTSSGREQVHKVPTSGGYLEDAGTWDEGILQIYAQVCINCTSTLQTWTLGVRVDGHLIGETGCSTASETSSRMLVCTAPVSAGQHQVEVVLRFAESSVDVSILTSNLLVLQYKV